MKICDICKGKVIAQERELPLVEYSLDMCDMHYKEYVKAMKLATELFRECNPVEVNGEDAKKLISRLQASVRKD